MCVHTGSWKDSIHMFVHTVSWKDSIHMCVHTGSWKDSIHMFVHTVSWNAFLEDNESISSTMLLFYDDLIIFFKWSDIFVKIQFEVAAKEVHGDFTQSLDAVLVLHGGL